jgi:hypothetical protein
MIRMAEYSNAPAPLTYAEVLQSPSCYQRCEAYDEHEISKVKHILRAVGFQFDRSAKSPYVRFPETGILGSESAGCISRSLLLRAYPILIVVRLISGGSLGRAAPSLSEVRVNRIALFS